ncbi:MAG TPA: hypothetical protein VEG30_19005 [Terriglobales bacterium]|nr:hypothetical protein [Terriglobales bacterium]
MIDIPSTVRARLKETAGASGSGHVDPNLLTAFAEQTLLAGERTFVMTHLSQCRDCRDVLALAVPIHQTELQAVGALAARSRPWWNLAAVRWSAVAATAAVVVAAVLMRTPQPQLPLAQMQAPSQVQQNVSTNKTELPGAANTLAESRPSAPAPIRAKQKRTISRDSTAEGLARADSQKTFARRDLDMMTAYRQDERAGQAREQDEKLAAALNTDVVVVGAENEAAKKMQAPGITSRAEAGGNEVQARTEPTKPTLGWTESVTPGIAWSVSQGRLLRSMDAGATWEPLPVDSRATLRTYWAFDTDIWAGGDNEALYRSSNAGETWTQVHPVLADGTILRGDITKLEFDDAQHGAVITSKGERWETKDGGASWKQR